MLKANTTEFENSDTESWGLNSDNEDDYYEETKDSRHDFASEEVPKSNGNTTYTLYDINDIQAAIDNKINFLVTYYNITTTLAQAILIKNNWSALESIKEFGENYIANTFKFTLEEAQNRRKNTELEIMITCECCYDYNEIFDMVEMPDCAHMLCTECFRGYCKTKIDAGQESIQASCPDLACNNIVPTSIFEKLLTSADF